MIGIRSFPFGNPILSGAMSVSGSVVVGMMFHPFKNWSRSAFFLPVRGVFFSLTNKVIAKSLLHLP